MCSGGLEDESLIGLQSFGPFYFGHNTPEGEAGGKGGLNGRLDFSGLAVSLELSLPGS